MVGTSVSAVRDCALSGRQRDGLRRCVGCIRLRRWCARGKERPTRRCVSLFPYRRNMRLTHWPASVVRRLAVAIDASICPSLSPSYISGKIAAGARTFRRGDLGMHRPLRWWRIWTPVAIVGALCLASPFSAWWIVESSYRASLNPPATHTTSPKTNSKSGDDYPNESVWDGIAAIPRRTVHDPVALWTLALSVFSGILTVVSIRQFSYLRRADRNARLAAVAARHSADVAEASLVKLERAFVFPKDFSVSWHWYLDRLIGIGGESGRFMRTPGEARPSN